LDAGWTSLYLPSQVCIEILREAFRGRIVKAKVTRRNLEPWSTVVYTDTLQSTNFSTFPMVP